MKLNYVSPRWSQEILDCSMPMTFDTYSVCSFGCLYCFSFFQKSHCTKGYLDKNVRAVNPDKVKAMFMAILSGNWDKLNKEERQFVPYVTGRYVMQWGALADQFDEFERHYGITLDLMRFFDEIDYPLSFSTKAAWWTGDERYMELVRRHPHNWHFKISIITADERKARIIEAGVPSPQERLEAIYRLARAGVHVTLRLRPYMIGVSEDYAKLIEMAKDAGADSVTTEFLCLEARADERLKARYRAMSRVAGFDIYKFYLENSPQHGYKRLSREIKVPIIHRVQVEAIKHGLRFYVSDAACRELNHAPNCCGVPPEWKSQTAHFGAAILIAKERGTVRFCDIEPGIQELFSSFLWYRARGFNTSSNKLAALYRKATMADWIRFVWNHPHLGTSPMKMYGGILVPQGLDSNEDVTYGYRVRSSPSKGSCPPNSGSCPG